MGRIYNEGDEVFFDPQDGDLVLVLNENNLMANLHYTEPLKDMVGIEDPRDQEWWTWFRYNTDPEVFTSLVTTAHLIGSVLMRQSATEHTNAQFFRRFAFTDTDYDELQEDHHE